MGDKMQLLFAILLMGCAVCVSGEENYEQRYEDKFVDEDDAYNMTLYWVEPTKQIIPEKIYAGPLKATNEDEVIVVSRDNVQQLVKTLLLAYTHSNDPTMTQLLKSSGLGALKTTFKYLGKEDFGETFLRKAQMLISELNLENDEEKVLGEFAEKYLEEHKFKIVVPESFLLHEKEMVEFLNMKKKMSRKKGRSMAEPEATQSLELYSVLPYTGKQFSTSIIPGLDLTWIALLGGMLAIPYYFWSDDTETTSTSRKDDLSPPVPSLLPPQFSPGFGLNEISNNKNNNGPQKRGRRPNRNRNFGRPQHLGQGGHFRNNKLPPGVDPKAAHDKNYRNWYNNYYFQQFKQHPPSILSPGAMLPPAMGLPPIGMSHPQNNAQLNILPAIHALAQGNPTLQPNIPHHFPRTNLPIGFNGGLVGFSQDANQGINNTIDRHFNSVNPSADISSGLVPPPESVNDPNRIDTEATQDIKENQEEDNIAEETIITRTISKNHPTQPEGSVIQPPNSIVNNNDIKQNEVLKAIAPGQLTVPGLRNIHNPTLLYNNQIRLNPGPSILNNPAPFRPTHIQNEAGITVQAGIPHHIMGLNPPQIGHIIPGHNPHQLQSLPPRSPLTVTPGLQWRPYNTIGHLNNRPHLRGVLPHQGHQFLHGHGIPNALSNFNGIRGVPFGLQKSILTTPMLPPPPPSEEVGSGEQRETFGSFRPDREGSSHFKVSFTDTKIRPTAENDASEKKSVEDNLADESIDAPTIVFAHPNDVIRIDGERGSLLGLTQRGWQSQQRPLQTQNKISKEEELIRQSVELLEKERQEKIQEQLRQLKIQRQQQMDQEHELRLQQQHQQHQQHIQLQKQELERQRQLKLQTHNQQSQDTVFNPRPLTQFFRTDDGFVPIHGPPTVPALIKPSGERHEIPKPSAFLDKLLAEQNEKETSFEITYAKPIKLNKKKEVSKEKSQPSFTFVSSTAAPTTAQPTVSPDVNTTPWSSVFVRKPTSRTGVPNLIKPNGNVRVVTSTSVITSRPIPLGKNPPVFYEFNGEPREIVGQKHIVIGEAISGEYNNNVKDDVNEIEDHPKESIKSGAKFASLEELLPNYEQDYRDVLREYQRKQLEVRDQQQVYDQVVEASEQLDDSEPTESKVVLVQNVAGFVNTKEKTHGDINRILKSSIVSQEETPETPVPATPERDSKVKGKSVPMYALDPFYGPRLSRADAIFAQMNIEEEGCREQVVCNMYKNPDVYTPLSDFLSRQLTVTLEELQKPQVADERILRFFRYLQAARTGQDGGDCLEKYPKCIQDTTRLSHKPILDAFYKVSDLMKQDPY